MVKIEFGPNFSTTEGAVCVYVAHRLKPSHVRFLDFNEEDKTIELCPVDGTYEIDDVKFVIEHIGQVYALDSRLTREFKGYIEAESIDVIKKFINRANEFAEDQKSLNDTEDTIKVFQNNYIWETENIIKKRSIQSVQLPKKVLDKLLKDVENFFSSIVKERYRSLEIPLNRVYMFYGPPGTGKTTLIQAMASHMNMNIANVEFDGDMSDKLFKRCLRRVPKNSLICIEDIDCLFQDRKCNDSFKNGVTFSGILNALDGISKLDNTMIIITTNHLDRLDDALKRRVDYFVKFDYSTKVQVRDQFVRFFPDRKDDFPAFWDVAKSVKMTPNILQKFFTRHLLCEDIIETSKEELADFASGEHSLEDIKEMYT